MKQFDFGTRSQARFGEGVRYELTSLLPQDGSAQVLVVGSKSCLARDPLHDLLSELRRVCSVHLFTEVVPNPRVSDVDKCVETFKDPSITHVVGVGGGSALDQAKATAMALSCGSSVTSLLASKNELPARQNKLYLMPTTSGTGAELSFGAILTDSASGAKMGLRGAAQAADVALVDPELTYSVPRLTSMETGFDVLTHALETYISNAASPYTADLSRLALERVFHWLPVLALDLSNREARRELSYASMMMGQTLALSTTCLPHRLQYPIGAATDTAHAAGLAAIYPAWLSHLIPHATEKLANCARWIGIEPTDKTEDSLAKEFVRAILDLMCQIDFVPTLKGLGVSSEMLASFPAEVTGKLHTDPSYNGPTDIATIYQSAFG